MPATAKKAEPITIPPEMANRGHDSVWYTYTDEGAKAETPVVGGACYATCMGKLTKCAFRLLPSDNKSVLPYDYFEEYVRLCQQNGLIVPGAVPSKSATGNELAFTGAGAHHHQVYATLCCYRWSENQPGMAWALVEAMRKIPGIDFFQAFHYGCASRVYWLYHSFHIVATKNGAYGSGGNIMSLPTTIAVAWMFRGQPPAGKPLVADMPANSRNTTETVNGIAAKFAGHNCLLKNMEDVLHPSLAKLFTAPVEPKEVAAAVAAIG